MDKKILILSNCPLEESQGSGYVIVNHANALIALGFEVELVGPEKLQLLPHLHGKGFIYRMILGMALYILKNKKKIAQYDIIQFYGAESFAAIKLIRKIWGNKKYIILHSNGIEEHVAQELSKYPEYITINKGWYHFDLKKYFRKAYMLSDMLITVSNYDRDYAIEEMHLSSSKVNCLEPGLPKEFLETDANIVSKQNIILYCGTWIERKGVKILEKVVPSILEKFPMYKFLMVGVGDNFSYASHFHQALQDRIEIIPYIKNKRELAAIYKTSRFFLFPSLCESFGLVVAEAMIYGCTVITGKTGYAYNLKNGADAITIESLNEEKIISIMSQLIQDIATQNEIAEKGVETASSLTWGKYKEQLAETMNRILNH